MIDQIVANQGENRPNPNKAFPNPNIPSLCYIKNVVKNPRIIIGDYTYYDDVDGADQFEKHVTHFYDFIGDKLIIGKFCAIAKGVEFVMNGANHRMDCATTYPFYIMGGDWGSAIAVGNPCRVVRKRFDDELIEILLKLRWWDKSIEEIENLMPILSCSDLEKVKEELKSRL